ncbi:MAG: chitobiase/beta-hexosaminidase C-terminal domain-containing protein [Ilumatobacter sp.]
MRHGAFAAAIALLVGAVTALVPAAFDGDTAQAGVYFNDTEFTYKEYWADHSSFTGGCHDDEVPGNSFYIEPLDCVKEIDLQITDDVSDAIAAVVYVNLWRNRTTNSARFTINDGPQYRPPDGDNYSRTNFAATVPLTQLQQGDNSFKFQEAVGPYHAQDVMIRVYYDDQNPIIPGPNSDVSPPNGELVSVQASGGPVLDPDVGGVLQVDGNQIFLEATASAAEFVEFHAYYDGYDEDNDGETLDWHNFLRNNYGPGGTEERANGATIGHIGTDSTPNNEGRYTATWNLPDVVSQEDVRFKIRVVDAQGNAREVAGGASADFDLVRSYSVEAYTIPDYRDRGLYFDTELPQVHSDTIDLPSDLADIDRAFILGNYWNSPDLSINDAPGFPVFEGQEDTWDTSFREIDPALLRPGSNTLRWSFRPPGFGAMIERPGPMVVIHRDAPTGPPVITRNPENVLVSAGDQASFAAAASGAPILEYQWLLDGFEIPGATSSTYVTPALLASDDGSLYSVRVTNGEGSATSAEAIVNVAAAPDDAAPWWDTQFDYRVPLTVFPESVARVDKVVDAELNFSDLMASAGAGGPSFDPDSIRVVEIDAAGVVIDPAVPFQFEEGRDYDPVSVAEGTVLWQLVGTTSPGQGRSYHVYFDKTYKNLPAAVIAPQVTRTEVIDEGFPAYQFDLADDSTWVFHTQAGGGFSKIIDKDDIDWIQWNTDEDENGDFRGTPNAVKPPAGYFHPGRPRKTDSTILEEGPLRITMESRAKDSSWISVWNIYPTYAEFEMIRANKEWWYLYEGTPGGEVDAADFIQRSDGVTVPIDGEFEADMPGEEWLYIADPADDRSFFMAHHQDDGAIESYRLLKEKLPVLGFGRGGLGLNQPYLTKNVNLEPQSFTTGLVDGTEFGPTGDHIRGAYKEVLVTVGEAKFNGVSDGAITDDFSAPTLSPFWTYVDNVGDTSLASTGAELVIDLPAGVNHSTWTGVDEAPRLVQPIGDNDLDIVVKFESLPVERWQGQGLIFLEDDQNWLRARVDHDGTFARFVVHKMVDGQASQVAVKRLPGVATRFVRAIRTGDVWKLQRSYNGTRWFGFRNDFTVPLDLTQAGITVSNSHEDTVPAFSAIVDYFESKTTGGLNDDAPQLSEVTVNSKARSAEITWTTNVPADTQLEWGSTASMDRFDINSDFVTEHSITIDFLRCETPYFFRPTSASDIGSTTGDAVTFTTAACPSIVSDDFSSGTLGDHWTAVDPVGDTLLTISDANAIISVPEGTDHNLFPEENFAPRLRQEAPIANFSVDAKFESVLSKKFQLQGIVVEEDDTNYLRFEIHHDGTNVRAYLASILDNEAITHEYITLPGGVEQYLRVERTGNTWTAWSSTDGVTWSQIGQFVADLQANYVGPYIGATAAGNATPPAFIGSIDYFFATDSPIVPEDGGTGADVVAPNVSNVQAQVGVPHSQAVTVTWDTNEPATTRVDWGFNTGYGAGPLVDNTALTEHSAVIEPVICGSTYQFRASSNDAAGNTGQSPNLTFTTGACPTEPFSDNFDTAELDPRWWIDDPRRDGTFDNPGGLLSMSVPGQARHDLTRNANTALRVLQPVENDDLQVTVGFESVVNFQSQLQGLIFEQDDQNLVRFDLYSDGTKTYAFVGQRTPNNLAVRANVEVPGATPGALRATRNGVNWRFEYSPDRGDTWQLVWNGVLSFNVSRVGPFVGNGNPTLANVPQHEALIDYFYSSEDPITITEPSALEAPVFEVFGARGEVWDGQPLEFGANGLTQPDVNILGNVTDPDGIASITYTVNDGQPFTMGLGSTDCPEGGVSCTRRLAGDGDFNADVDSSLLNPGVNTVTIRAIDNAFNASEIDVLVDFTPGNTWPMPYSVDWSTVTDLNDVAQPVDGRWQVEGDTVRATEIGYDRLLTFGDETWTSFEAEVPVLINSFDPQGYFAPSGGPAVGFIPHWMGHTQAETTQPAYGFSGQLGALVWYRYRDDNNGERLEIRDSNAVLVAEDLSGATLQTGTQYIFKMQAETGGGAGPLYRLKVWREVDPEPTEWNIVTALGPDAPDAGSLALVAHHTDVNFGDLQVRQITAQAPEIIPESGTYTGLAKIEMDTGTRAAEIRYTVDGSDPDENSLLYTEPFFVTESTTIKAKTYREGFFESTITQRSYTILQPPDRVETGLQAIYRFDDDGGTVASDTAQVGAALDLEIAATSDVTWLTDVDALRINDASVLRTPLGVNRINTAIQDSQSFTIEAWIDPATLDLGDGTLFNIGSEDPGQQNLAITQNGRTFDIDMRTSNTNSNGEPGRNTGAIVPPQLHHMVYVRRPDNRVYVYVDGELAWESFVGGSLFPWAAGYGLGVANSVEETNPWLGDLYLLAIYSEDLQQSEIVTNYQSGPFPPPANFAPQINAGPDITLVEGEVAQMAATASDDGNPTPPGTLTVGWTQVSGPATAVLASSTDPTTTVTLPTDGRYVFEWSGDDGEKTTTDEMIIDVIEAGSQAPAPSITPDSGVYPGQVEVVIETSVPNGQIRFTTDGTEPTVASPLYTGPFPVTETTTVQARVYRTNLADSDVTTRNYLITVDSRVDDGLVLFYPFNEASGATIKDRSSTSGTLNLTVQNYGRTTRVDSGLRIDQPTLIQSTSGAGKIVNPVKQSKEITVEMWLSAANLGQTDVMPIGISANPNARSFGMIQNGEDIVAYMRTRDTNSRGEPPTSANGVVEDQMFHLVYTRAEDGTTKLYVNGNEVASGLIGNNLGNWVQSHRLHLGSERDNSREWLGTYYLVAFYDRALTRSEVVQNFAFGDV